MQLYALINDMELAVGKPILGHSSSDFIKLSRDEPSYAIVHENTPDVSLGFTFCQLEARVLQVKKRFTEGFPFFHVAHCDLDRALGCRNCAEGDGQPLIAELVHYLEQTAPFSGAKQILDRYAHTIEEQLAGILGMPTDLLEQTTDPITRQIPSLEHQQR